MTDKAKEARRAYKRAWNKRNPDKVKKYQADYWNRKAQQAEAEKAEAEAYAAQMASALPF